MATAAARREIRRTTLSDITSVQLPLATADHTATTRMFGVETLVFYAPDPVEQRRRIAAAAQPLRRMRDLATLLRLPAGMPIPLSALGPGEVAEVQALPTGAAELGRQQVVRLAVRPLSVDLVLVKASGPRKGLVAAGRFAPFTRRAILLRRSIDADDMLLLEAAFYGIGVFVHEDDEMRMLVEPEPFRRVRHNVAGWQFVERLHQQLHETIRLAEPER